MKFGVIIFCLLQLAQVTFAQKVGVVLSGGAAKGIAHVGVLKALEENEIPIDYVVGTSMGGIVAGCYAAGLSPAQIEEIMLSQPFLDWVNGRIGKGNDYYYFKKEDEPSFLKLNLALDSTFNVLLNTTLANDLSLNFALTDILAQPSGIAKNNFDSLFVPLRVVASDIFTQTQVIMKRGVLSDALRATQTVPFFYNPIRIDGKYLFDGGVYNNFPVDVLQNEFHPDLVIGCNVSSKVYNEYPYGEDEKLITRSLLYMLLDKSDPTKIPATGVYIQPDLTNFTAFDFAKAKGLIDSGYAQTMRQMRDIKSKIESRRTCEDVAAKRNTFNSKAAPIIVNELTFDGFTSGQRKYLNRFFKSGKRPLYFSDVKNGYFKLVSEDYFNNVYPSLVYNNVTHDYKFKLTRRPLNNFQVDFGGVIATRNVSNIYLGLNYYIFNRALIHTQVNVATGDFYKSADLKARFDFPFLGQFCIEPQATFNNWNFIQGNDIVAKQFTPTVLDRVDRKAGASVGFPIGHRYKFSLHGYYINNNDQYINNSYLVSTDTLDQLKLSGFRYGASLSTNTLNKKQYANEGYAYRFSFNWFNLTEEFKPGNTSVNKSFIRDNRFWWQAKITLEQYFRKGIYSSGYYLEGVLSDQPTFANYFGTIINAPAFNPLQDSRTLLLQHFRAFDYAAGGWRNVFSIRKNLDFRLEGYVFKPFQTILQGNDQKANVQDEFQQIYLAATAGLVLHSAVGPISLSFNYYDDKNRQYGVLLHVGFLLFNKTSLD